MKLSRTLKASLCTGFLLSAVVGPPHYICAAGAAEAPYVKQLERGLRKLKKGDYEDAVSCFTSLLKDYPTVYEAYLKRAGARAELKDLDGALKDYEQAIKTNPNATESYLERGALYLKLGDRAAAIADYSEALRLSPRDGKARLLRAQVLHKNGDYAGAVQDLDQVLKVEPGNVVARKERADCKSHLELYDEAIADYEYLLKKNGSKVFPVHYELGEALQLKGDKKAGSEHFNLVVQHYTRELSRSSKKGGDYIYRGMAYYQLGEKEKALRDLESGVALLTDDAQANYQLGHLKYRLGDNEGALKVLDRALKLDPKLHPALVDRAEIYSSQGDFGAALTDLNQALALSRSPEELSDRAMVRLSIGDVGGGVQDILEASKLSPTFIGRKQKEVAEKLEAASGKPESARLQAGTLLQIALLDLACGNIDSAESTARQAISILDKLTREKKLSASDPQNAYALLLLGNVYLKKRSLVEAESLFRIALNKLRNTASGEQKYAVFSLEECAKMLIAASSMEEAGSILSDTRLVRATTGLTENAFSSDMSRKAEQAVEAYKQKRKYDRQEDLVRRAASGSASAGEEGTGGVEEQIQINRPIRDKWALIVGTGRFKDSRINLKYAAKDAEDFANFLIKEKEFAPDHIQLLTNEAATRANILSLLGSKWLPRVAERDDLVVIYFSSHGSPSSLDVGGVNYLVAHDTDPNDLYATGIAMQDLARIIKGRVHCDRIMLVLDACHSGSAGPSTAAGKGMERAANVNVEQVMQGTGQLVISSSKPDQRSWESSRYEGSVFTKYLIEGLRRNGKLTKLGDAYAYLESEVQREVLRDRGVLQTPVMRSKWRGTDLIIGVTPAQPSPGLGDIELPDAVDSKLAKGSGKSATISGGGASAGVGHSAGGRGRTRGKRR